MLGHRRMSGEDKSKEAVVAEGQSTATALLRTQTSLWMQNLTWFQGHIWEKPLEIRSSGSYRQTTSGSGNTLRQIYLEACTMLRECYAYLSRSREGRKEHPESGSGRLCSGQKWCAGHVLQEPPSQEPTSCPVCSMADAPQHLQPLCHWGRSR